MADTVRALSALQTTLADNTARAISAQDLRDAIYSVLGVVPYVAKTAHYTVTESDEFISVDTSGGAVTITLPAVATTRVGKVYVIKVVESTNDVTIDANSTELIDGAQTLVLPDLYDCAVIVNTGAKWLIQSLYTP